MTPPLHWREYVIEAVCLGTFMVSASSFGVLLEYPGSPVHQAIGDPLLRRMVMGLAMAGTLLVIVYSPLGTRSGAHMNPAVTMAFVRLGRVDPRDAVGYVGCQFLGGLAGVGLAAWLLGPWLAHPAVDWVATRPGVFGASAALAAEFVMTFVMMTTVLAVSNHPRWTRYTGLAAASLVFLYITVEAPVSGMSLNPARTTGPAVFARHFDALWVYFAAPLAGMLAAAEAFVRTRGVRAVHCAKLHHGSNAPCIFRCRYGELTA
jgi:aquaporin Z